MISPKVTKRAKEWNVAGHSHRLKGWKRFGGWCHHLFLLLLLASVVLFNISGNFCLLSFLLSFLPSFLPCIIHSSINSVIHRPVPGRNRLITSCRIESPGGGSVSSLLRFEGKMVWILGYLFDVTEDHFLRSSQLTGKKKKDGAR